MRRLAYLCVCLAFLPAAFADQVCTAYCVTASDQPVFPTNDTFEILRAYVVQGSSAQELITQCPSYFLGKTMLLKSFTPIAMRAGQMRLPGDFLRSGNYTLATERNVCADSKDAPLKQ